MSRDAALIALYGDATVEAIARSRVLVVGAGGIGCELLKNIVLSGFKEIEVIDLDTIDVSNLNRQFLFRRSHVGQSKSMIAREAVLAMNPNANINIKAYHDNIKSTQFDRSFFGSFTVVLNALDNIEARRHVNRLCIAANVPLIESGTQGYAGQVFPILPHSSECYECNAISAPKTFAVCTIRSTPEKPVHCIVWAKLLYNALFGEEDEANVMNDMRQFAVHTAAASSEKAAIDPADARSRAHEFTQRLCSHLFNDAIMKQLENVETWTTRKAPMPLPFNLAVIHTSEWDDDSFLRSRDQSVLSLEDTVNLLESSVQRLLMTRPHLLGTLAFDKDDDVSMDIVTTLANLRMRNFHISPLSRFAVKGIAGNIVHAVATTNAIAAGIIVCQAIKLIQSNALTSEQPVNKSLRQVYISAYKPHLLHSQPLEQPKPQCYICGDQPVVLSLNTKTFTLKRLYDEVCVKALSFQEPAIDIYSADNAVGTKEDCSPEYLERTLESINCGDGAMLRIEDEAQALTVSIQIQHHEFVEATNSDDQDVTRGYKLSGLAVKPVEPVANQSTSQSTNQTTNSVIDDDDDDLLIVDENGTSAEPEAPSRKRQHSPDVRNSKRARTDDEIETID